MKVVRIIYSKNCFIPKVLPLRSPTFTLVLSCPHFYGVVETPLLVLVHLHWTGYSESPTYCETMNYSPLRVSDGRAFTRLAFLAKRSISMPHLRRRVQRIWTFGQTFLPFRSLASRVMVWVMQECLNGWEYNGRRSSWPTCVSSTCAALQPARCLSVYLYRPIRLPDRCCRPPRSCHCVALSRWVFTIIADMLIWTDLNRTGSVHFRWGWVRWAELHERSSVDHVTTRNKQNEAKSIIRGG